MFKDDQEIISHALRMWANLIETGDCSISAVDAINMGRKRKEITLEQSSFILKLRGMADNEYILPG